MGFQPPSRVASQEFISHNELRQQYQKMQEELIESEQRKIQTLYENELHQKKLQRDLAMQFEHFNSEYQKLRAMK